MSIGHNTEISCFLVIGFHYITYKMEMLNRSSSRHSNFSLFLSMIMTSFLSDQCCSPLRIFLLCLLFSVLEVQALRKEIGELNRRLNVRNMECSSTKEEMKTLKNQTKILESNNLQLNDTVLNLRCQQSTFEKKNREYESTFWRCSSGF
jgi:Ca2+/Na+ antiporter